MKAFKNLGILLLLLFFFSTSSEAQLFKKNRNDSIRKNSILVLPVVFYLPETRWSFGGFGMYNFYVNKEDTLSPNSQVQLGAAYTQNDQVLFYAPYNLFWGEGKWRANGEIGYYRYSYDFFGVGPEIDKNFSELYEVDFPRFRVHVNRNVAKHIFIGGQYWYEDQQINTATFDPEGLLQQGNVPGSEGGVTAGAGLLLTFDSRDNVNFPKKGFFIKGTAHYNSRLTLSDYSFSRYRMDFRHFFTPKKNHTFANQVFLDHILGNAPFTQMAFFGGSSRARGYYPGRYRDKNMLLYQFEYRPIIYKNIGATVFFNYGAVSSQLSLLSLNQANYSYGIGLRYAYDPSKRVNIRFDAAFGPGTSAFYFTFGEAF